MIKYFCDGCGVELPEPYYDYTLEFALCDICYPKFLEKYTKGDVLVLPSPDTHLNLNNSLNNE